MSYHFRLDEPVDQGLRRIATELIDDNIAWAERSGTDQQEVVHEVRKNCKKLRGLLRLVRPRASGFYAEENGLFRDAAQSLSMMRDADASIETYDALMDHFHDQVDRQSMGPIRRALTLHRQALAEEGSDLSERLAIFRETMIDSRARVQDWELPMDDTADHGFDLLGPGLAKTYRRGRQAMVAAEEAPSVAAFHEWRKRAKYLRYHLRLLRPAWPPLLKRARGEAKTLSDLLGDDHNLAVLQETLLVALKTDPDPERTHVFEALMEKRGIELREKAHWLGMRIYAEKPKALRKRMRHYWKAAHQECKAAAVS